jgi:hypothetical protein
LRERLLVALFRHARACVEDLWFTGCISRASQTRLMQAGGRFFGLV